MIEISVVSNAATAQPACAEATDSENDQHAPAFSLEDTGVMEPLETSPPAAEATTHDPLQSLLEDLSGISSALAPLVAPDGPAVQPEAAGPAPEEPDDSAAPVAREAASGRAAQVMGGAVTAASEPAAAADVPAAVTEAEAPPAPLAQAQTQIRAAEVAPGRPARGDLPQERESKTDLTQAAGASSTVIADRKGALLRPLMAPAGTKAAPATGTEFLALLPDRPSAMPDVVPADFGGTTFLAPGGTDSGMSLHAAAPRHAVVPVPRQMAQALVSARDELVEIALAPEELGRIRMIVTGPEQAPHVTVWVERPEVLEQLRRNTAFLQECFGDAGMTAASFEFQGGGQFESQGDRATAQGGGQTDMAMADLPATVPLRWTPTLVPARLDIRI